MNEKREKKGGGKPERFYFPTNTDRIYFVEEFLARPTNKDE